MTNSEAIETLKANYPDPCYGSLREAVDVAIEVLSKEQESYKDKLKEIADELSEKFAYMNTCLNERDIILGYLGVKRPTKLHCDTDCTDSSCPSNIKYNLPSAQPEVVRCKDCKHRPTATEADKNIYTGFSVEFPDGICPCQCEDGWYNWYPEDDFYCGKAERRGES